MRWLPGSLATPVRQPMGGARVDRNNPIARGLIYAYVPNGGGGGIVTAGSPTIEVASYGRTENWGQSGFELPASAGLGGLITSAQTYLVVGAPSSASFSVLLLTASGSFRRWSNNWAILSASGGRNLATGGQWTGPAVIVARAPANVADAGMYEMFRDGVNVSNNGNNLGASNSSQAANVFQSNTGDRSAATYWAAATGLVAKWDRYLSNEEVQSISRNPWQLLAPTARPIWAPTLSVTVYRPGSDNIVNGWTSTPSGSLASCIDDPALDRADFITSPDLTSPATLAWASALPAGTWSLSIDADRTGASGQVRVVCLDAGGTSVGATAWQALTGTATTYTLSVITSAISTQFRIEVQA